jgi:Sec-independent protein translocase protein TatA
VGFGTEILFLLMLALVVLGPKQLHAMLGHAARAKAKFQDVSRGLKSQLTAELEAREGKAVSPDEMARQQ